MSPSDDPQDPAARLEQLLRSKHYVCFYEDVEDKEYPYVKCSIYGAHKTNELFVKLTNGRVSFVGVVPSSLIYPAMADRIFGMDVSDQADALALADLLWETNKEALIAR